MATLANTAEGGTATATVTTANSGSTSGNAWDNVTIGSGGGITYDTGHAYGSLAYKFVSAATTTFVAWTSASVGTQATLYGRCYLYLTANPAAELAIARLRLGTTQTIRLGITTAGKLVLRNTANSQVGLQTNSVALNTWIRVEFKVTASSTAGVFEVKLYNSPDSTTATETTSLTSQVLTDNLDAVNWGPVGTTSGVTSWMDGLASSTAGYLGPAVQSATASDTVTGSDTPARVVTASRAPADAATVADTPTRAVSRPRTASDSLTPADTPSRSTAGTRGAAVTLTATDSATRSTTVSQAIIDATNTTDTPATALSAARNTTDATGLADAPSRQSSRARSTADSLLAADEPAMLVAMSRPSTDTLTAAGAISGSAGTAGAASDTLTAAATQTRTVTLTRHPADSVATVEDLERLLTLHRLTADTLTLADRAAVPLDVTITAGSPHRGWSAGEPVRRWTARIGGRMWVAGDPHL